MRKVFALLLLLVSIVVIAACAGVTQEEPAGAPADVGAPAAAADADAAPEQAPEEQAIQVQSTVRVGVPTDMPSAAPFATSNSQTQIMTNSTFSRLVNIDTSDFSVHPGLASSWESNEDATVWTFRLRELLQLTR